ncbi:MAG: cytochrome d ubiquinol oxidase subunit II [Sphingomonadaceae bacterium]|uniref:cytochrome d ubiquinol oxidase subunit II n=1 Tax=Thermaurantiacus sp. TaxID=2820283 RepID=UPI00298F38C3|nr:cytochrome d ubiquinol oxidase subunit II [Thermaurantiacus sp.]MCS6987234.1 cytochrome d ubiquinol oxidase subunit II [Sphingomonadaceae bacterium]MDW8414454.1 cytochrome d ubiquinol oxidase subunit II [Thermaurantiacus sp.]
MTPFLPPDWLPVIFAALMGVAILFYVVLDGFDLGVGILTRGQPAAERSRMIASIGPFWDANETWLVLGIGLLLVAFPIAHGIILTALYLPVAIMLVGLILRGVAFEFRAKAPRLQQGAWDAAFFWGSLLAALAQGWMLGAYILAFDTSLPALLFCALTAVCLAAGYAFVGASWLIWKTDGALQVKAVRWARVTLLFTALGILAVSVATPLVSPRIFARWFRLPEFILLAPIPLMTGLLVLGLLVFLRRHPRDGDRLSWVPMVGATALFALGFFGLAYSFYPYVVPDRLTIWQAAASPESLSIILVGTLFVLPVILAYSAFAHWVFRGKASELSYG